MLFVVVHIRHAGLLVGAQQGADGIALRRAIVLKIFQRVQAQDAGAFVIGHAAAQQPAVPHPDGVGVSVPAVALRHHIGVGDGGQKFLSFGNGSRLRPTDIPFGVVGGKTQLTGNFQRLVQRRSRSRAKGRARLRRAFHAGDRHQTGDVPQNVVSVVFHKGVNGRPTGVCHTMVPPTRLMPLLYHICRDLARVFQNLLLFLHLVRLHFAQVLPVPLGDVAHL